MIKLPRLVTAALVVSAFSVACTPEPPKYAFSFAERRGKLSTNDLRFVLMPDATTDLVNVSVRWDVGSREDPPGKAGLAHVVEHLMFQPRPDGPNSPPLFESISALAVGGDMNAFTAEDMTHYYETVRASDLDAALKIEALRQFYFMDTITEVEFERERDVVRNEIRQRSGTAEGQLDQLVLSAIYPKGHAYAETTGGDDAQLSSITLQDAKDFVQKYYAPERATILVDGGFNIDTAVASIEKWFGKLPKRAAAPRKAVAPVVMTPGTQQFELDVDRPMVGVAFALPAVNTPEGEAAEFGVQNAIIRTLIASQEYDFATSVGGKFLGGQLAPVFMITVQLKSMDKLDEALDFIKKSVKEAYRGFDEGTKQDIEERQNIEKLSFIEGLERLGDRNVEIANVIQFDSDTNFDSTDLYLKNRLDKFAKFDGARVAAAVKKYIDWDKAKIFVIKATSSGIKGDTRTTVAFDKQKDEAIVNPDVDPNDALRPVLVKAELKGLTGAKHVTLGNGMNIVMMPTHAMPIVRAQLIFKNVGAASTPDNPALARMAAEFLRLPPDAEAFERTGVGADCDVDQDDTFCQSSGAPFYLDVVLHALERTIKTSDFSQEAVEKWQKRTKDRLATKTAQESLEFRRQIQTAFDGADHPYTVSSLLTGDVIGKLHKDALDTFVRTHYSAGNATLILVGDFDPDAAERSIRSVFGGWDKGTLVAPVGKATAKHDGPTFIGVVAKEEPQVTVVMGYPSTAGIDGQEFARKLIADMLQSRVDNVRFKLGTTYGMFAFHSTAHGPTAYQIQGKVDALRAGESIKAIRDGIDGLRKGDDFNLDFVRARRKELHDLIGGATVTSEIADRLGFIASFGLPDDYYGRLLSQIGAAPVALVKALISSELNPQNEIIVLKGSRAQLDKAFADAGITDVKIVEPEIKN
jgi:zinc protease|nr:insulinase family protein [Kofleriaceae bacterium]